MTIDDTVDCCIWHIIMTDPNSTTREEAIKYQNKSLMNCYYCPGTEDRDNCSNYKSYLKVTAHAHKD
jgi:hypothetical protein